MIVYVAKVFRAAGYYMAEGGEGGLLQCYLSSKCSLMPSDIFKPGVPFFKLEIGELVSAFSERLVINITMS